MEELEKKYIKEFLTRISEEIKEKEIKFIMIKDLERRLKILDALFGTKVQKGDFVKLYNEVSEVQKEYIEKLKLIHDKYYKDIIEDETNEK